MGKISTSSILGRHEEQNVRKVNQYIFIFIKVLGLWLLFVCFVVFFIYLFYFLLKYLLNFTLCKRDEQENVYG